MRLLQKTTTHQNIIKTSPKHSCKLWFGEHCRSGVCWGARESGVCCEIVYRSNTRGYSHKGSLTWLPSCELNKDDINEHAKLYTEKLMRPWPYTTNCSQLKTTRKRRGSLSLTIQRIPPQKIEAISMKENGNWREERKGRNTIKL